MMKNKRFDCVQMKWEIQRRLEEEMPGVPEVEKRKLQMERVAKDPLLGRFVPAAQKGVGRSGRPST